MEDARAFNDGKSTREPIDSTMYWAPRPGSRRRRNLLVMFPARWAIPGPDRTQQRSAAPSAPESGGAMLARTCMIEEDTRDESLRKPRGGDIPVLSCGVKGV